MKRLFQHIVRPLLLIAMVLMPLAATAQQNVPRHLSPKEIGEDTTWVGSSTIEPIDSVVVDSTMGTMMVGDSVIFALGDTLKHHHVQRDWATWKPDVKRALWLALVIPGAGQIYNRKYWKLPIFYGGFVGCIYAMRWNGMMYRDYSQAYLDIMDSDPNTQSYNKFLHLGTQINESNMAHWQEVFRKRKDRYRRWRDLGFFAMVGVYALSVIDAYVDASLSEFDISPDLSLHIAPAVVNSDSYNLRTAGLGLQCSVTF